MAGFPNDFGLAEFERAWVGEADERLTAYPDPRPGTRRDQRLHQDRAGAVRAERLDPQANLEPKSTEALKHLRENGVIGAATHTALKDA